MAIDNWQPTPLWVLLVLLVVIRISFVLSPLSFHGLWQDVEREIALQVVVVGLPLLVVHEVAGADLGSIRSPQSIAARKDKGIGMVFYFSISLVLPHGRESATYKDNSTLC
jgi:hypothetical protein